MQKSILVVLLSGSLSISGLAEESTKAKDSTPVQDPVTSTETDQEEEEILPDAEAIQQELEGLPQEERLAKLKEYREKYAARQASDIDRSPSVSTDQWRTMTPEQRSAYLKKLQGGSNQQLASTPEEKKAQLKKIQANLDQRIKELQLRTTTGTITDREAQLLTRYQAQQRRLEMRMHTLSHPLPTRAQPSPAKTLEPTETLKWPAE